MVVNTCGQHAVAGAQQIEVRACHRRIRVSGSQRGSGTVQRQESPPSPAPRRPQKMKELKKQHREELEEETYRAAKKANKEAFAFERENYQLKIEIQILTNKVEGLEKVIEINSNDNVSITTSESEDENELEKEQVHLD